MSNKFVDCTIRNREGRRHCNFNWQNAGPDGPIRLSQQPRKVEGFNYDTFPAKIDNRREKRDARYWNIKNDMTTVNMVPSFGAVGGGTRDNDFNSTLEYQTGDFIFREFQKREIEPHFTPYKTNVPNINYTYNRTRDGDDFAASQRLNINSYKEGERPAWTWTQVGPGLNKGYTNCGSEGYHPFWRSPVPTYEELTNKTRPEFDFRNHVIYGRMENFDNATTDLMEWTREKNPTAWKDRRDKVHGPTSTAKSSRRRAQIVMNTNRKLTPRDYYGDSHGLAREQRRDASQHPSRQRGDGVNKHGKSNLKGPDQGMAINQGELKANILRNLRRKYKEEAMPMGAVDRAVGTVGALDYDTATFTKNGAIDRRNYFTMNTMRTGNVDMEMKDNQYILPPDLAPGTRKEEILDHLQRIGMIDTQMSDWYLDPEAPQPTLKQFLIHNLYTAAVDGQTTSVAQHPDAPRPTIKQTNLRRGTDTSVLTGHQAPSLKHNVHKPAATRKDGTANVDYVRRGGASQAPMAKAHVQTKANRAIQAHPGNAKKSTVIAKHRAGQITRNGNKNADPFTKRGIQRSRQLSREIPMMPRQLAQGTRSSKKMSAINSRLKI